MSLHPLLDLANDREVKQAKGFRAVAAEQTGEKLEVLFKQEADSAPSRTEKGKKYLGVKTGRIPRAPQAGKDDRHAAMAVGAWMNAGGDPIELPGGQQLTVVDHLVPLRTAAPDKAQGESDPNKGVEDIDLLAQFSDGRLAVVRVKFLAPDAARGTGAACTEPPRGLAGVEGLHRASHTRQLRSMRLACLGRRTTRANGGID